MPTARPRKIRLNDPKRVQAFTDDSVIERWKQNASSLVLAKDEKESDTTITIYDVIGEDFWTGEGVTVKRIDAALRSIGERDVTVAINSPGGDMFEGIAIFNRLREHPGKITVKVVGYAASAASIIAMAGDRVEIGQAAFLMIHNAWVFALGNRHELREVADWLEPFDKAMVGVYSARTGMDDEKIEGLLDNETWMGAEDAIEMGFADALLPADAQEKSKNNAKAKASETSAVRSIERALMGQGRSRSQARSLIKEFKGTPDAAHTATPDAGILSAIADLKKALEP